MRPGAPMDGLEIRIGRADHPSVDEHDLRSGVAVVIVDQGAHGEDSLCCGSRIFCQKIA